MSFELGRVAWELGAREQAATLVEDARTALGAAEGDTTRVRSELDAWVAEHPGL